MAKIVASSKLSLLLSRQEGSNRSVYESMFCNTPVIVYRHRRGINLEHINSRTGLLADDDELADAIATIVEHAEEFEPRAWALAHIGYENATRIVNDGLRKLAAERGLLWTRDIVARRTRRTCATPSRVCTKNLRTNTSGLKIICCRLIKD